LQNSSKAVAAVAFLAALTGCTTGQSGVEPAFSSVNQNQNKANFAVGTANLNGTPGLNTVATYRQPNGLSATLLNTPSIVGPASFLVPAVGSAGTDGGTNTISASAQAQPGAAAAATTFGQSGGVFGYGFAPANSTTSGASNFPRFAAAVPNAPNNAFCVVDPSPVYGTCISINVYSQPLYVSSAKRLVYLGGPPAYPSFSNGTFPTGFGGYPAGFTTFAATPVPGAYTLNINVPSGNVAPFDAAPVSANLVSTALLPTISKPTFTSDGTGGATIGVDVPPGVTEALVYVFDFAYGSSGEFSRKNFYTINTTQTGPQTLSLPNNLGPTGNDQKPTASLVAGDFYFVYVAGFDYPAFEAGPPGNLQQVPTLAGANGQADVTLSGYTTNTY